MSDPNSFDDLEQFEPLDAVARLESQMFRSGSFDAFEAVGEIVRAALNCGAKDVAVHRVDSWFFISSLTDWLVEDGRDVSERAFSRICSYKAGGDNSMRPEVLLTAFTNSVITVSASGVRVVKGSSPNTDAIPAGTFGRLVGFSAA